MITAAADGSSLSNPGPAGWAWYVDDDHWAAGGWDHGTNNMGELMAVLDLLRQTRGEKLRVLCDSQYVINCCTKWIPGWKRRGWRKADNTLVLNVELLKEIDTELAGRDISFEWVKGHAGHALNEAADLRARNAALAHQQGKPVNHGPGYGGAAESLAVAPSVKRQPEPDLFEVSEPNDAAIIESLLVDFVSDRIRLDRDRLAEILHADFVGFGPGEQIRTRGSLLARAAELPGRTEVDVLGIDALADSVMQARFRLRREGEVTLGSSIWVKESGDWKLRFQQVS